MVICTVCRVSHLCHVHVMCVKNVCVCVCLSVCHVCLSVCPSVSVCPSLSLSLSLSPSCLCLCLSLCLCRTNLHVRVALQASPDKQNYNHKPVIVTSKMPALARCTQKSGGVNSYTQQLSCARCVGAGNQRAVLVKRHGNPSVMPHHISVEAHPAEMGTSKLPPSIDLLPPFVEAAAFLVVSWTSAAFTVRGHLLFSNALSQARHACHLGQAPTR